MKKVYLVVENPKCWPPDPYRVVEVFTSKKKAWAFLDGHPNRWIQTWTPEK